METQRNKRWFLSQICETVKFTGVYPYRAYMHPADFSELRADLDYLEDNPFAPIEFYPVVIVYGVRIIPQIRIREGSNPIFIGSERKDFSCCFSA